mgnify:CR=1 FL=1
MNSHQLIYEINKLLSTIQKQKYLMDLVKKISGHSADLPTNLIDLIRNSTKDQYGNIAASEINSRLTKIFDIVMAQLKDLRSRELFLSISEVESAIKSFDSYGRATENVVSPLQKYLLEFSTSYEQYLNALNGTQRETALINLILSGGKLASAISTSNFVLSDIKNKLEGYALLKESADLKRFSLYTDSHVDFSRFAHNLYSINIIYIELCNLLKISLQEHPIVIVKIESGSAWTEFLAYPKIVDLLVSLIERSVDYFYRTFTREGKITALPRKVEAVEEIIELRKKMMALGIETSQIDAEITKATFVIADELNKLLAGEPKISVNGKIISIGKSFEKKYLEAHSRYLLPKFDKDN